MAHPTQMSATDTGLLVIDVQDKLLPLIPDTPILVTNIAFESWAEYLGDAPLAMALLDRVVDGAIIVKLKGKSYRVHRGPNEESAR